jgi:hypothetical protein
MYPRYSLNKTLGGPKGLSGCLGEEKICCLRPKSKKKKSLLKNKDRKAKRKQQRPKEESAKNIYWSQ